MKHVYQIADLVIVSLGPYFYNNAESSDTDANYLCNTECVFWNINAGITFGAYYIKIYGVFMFSNRNVYSWVSFLPEYTETSRYLLGRYHREI